ncbi:hypothetical protein BJ912DRAFT_35262 [Pholiota molesta]|nr:hypothetical protein BJ912DRAFT_35262 [Pholiota molesta]
MPCAYGESAGSCTFNRSDGQNLRRRRRPALPAPSPKPRIPGKSPNHDDGGDGRSFLSFRTTYRWAYVDMDEDESAAIQPHGSIATYLIRSSASPVPRSPRVKVCLSPRTRRKRPTMDVLRGGQQSVSADRGVRASGAHLLCFAHALARSCRGIFACR